MSGYLPKRRTKVVTADWDVEDGGEPFQATIVTNLTFDDIDAIHLTNDTTYGELFPVIAPYVVAWNAMGRNSETGEYELLPPPAEAGPDVFKKVEPMVTTFLALKLRTVHLGDPAEREKKELSSDVTPDGKSGTGSTSRPQAMSRRNRKITT